MANSHTKDVSIISVIFLHYTKLLRSTEKVVILPNFIYFQYERGQHFL